MHPVFLIFKLKSFCCSRAFTSGYHLPFLFGWRRKEFIISIQQVRRGSCLDVAGYGIHHCHKTENRVKSVWLQSKTLLLHRPYVTSDVAFCVLADHLDPFNVLFRCTLCVYWKPTNKLMWNFVESFFKDLKGCIYTYIQFYVPLCVSDRHCLHQRSTFL